MPLAVGNRWDYAVVWDDGSREERSLSITVLLMKDTWSAADGPLPCFWSRENDIVTMGAAGVRTDLLYLPPVVGNGWWTSAPGGRRAWCRVTGREDVRVPAGNFRDCVHVLMLPEETALQMDYWFAPGVGLVRCSEGRRGRAPSVVRELTGYALQPPK
jgi:hypothetical protein